MLLNFFSTQNFLLLVYTQDLRNKPKVLPFKVLLIVNLPKKKAVFQKKCAISPCTQINFSFSSNSENKTKLDKDNREHFPVH